MARWGMTIPLDRVPLLEHADWVRELADLGYTDFWSSEAGGSDGFTPLVLAASWAPGARVGSAIVPAYTRGPGTLALCVAGLAEAAPGRAVFGIGSSSNVIVERWNAMRFEKPYERTRDTTRFLKKALTGERVAEKYETFEVRGFRLGRVPAVQPSIMIAALREGMLRLAGRESDGAILNWLSAEDVKTVARPVRETGPDAELVARLFVCPTEDRDLVDRVARTAIAAYLNVPVYAAFHEWLGRGEVLRGMWDAWRAGDRKAALEAIPASVIDELIIHGSPDACRAHIERYVDAGVDTPVISLMPCDVDPREAGRALAPAG